ncbi:hypothetical protein CRUP_036832 [Coryphaenoides rupestris]|nr:hypothetical protein CRUP_036832 [Coryphaenoides rupestris]
MAAARGALKKNATMLYTASQAFLRHPDVAATRANRDYVFKQRGAPLPLSLRRAGELADATPAVRLVAMQLCSHLWFLWCLSVLSLLTTPSMENTNNPTT